MASLMKCIATTSAVMRLFQDSCIFSGRVGSLDSLMRNRGSLDAPAAGEYLRHIAEAWQEQLDLFSTIRAELLLYERLSQPKLAR